ncbi:hypothetical protein MPRI_37690 [Mycobacterium paraintracellulare]|uniref:Uncharacterized protein n=1 Tax=Mycobacterium paraintracellulare TaxID=1138383 RepID=A0ABN6AX84_9MYCO|nr:hypothetical protein MPRI_37690 [Mycobacterium paraintracellulare]
MLPLRCDANTRYDDGLFVTRRVYPETRHPISGKAITVSLSETVALNHTCPNRGVRRGQPNGTVAVSAQRFSEQTRRVATDACRVATDACRVAPVSHPGSGDDGRPAARRRHRPRAPPWAIRRLGYRPRPHFFLLIANLTPGIVLPVHSLICAYKQAWTAR